VSIRGPSHRTSDCDPATSERRRAATVAAGGFGCVGAGLIADRIGRTAITMIAMALRGSSALLIGFLFGAAPPLTLGLGIVWVSPSCGLRQLSVAVTELGPAGSAGSALALQTVAGFLQTGVTILVVGALGATGGE
jgi:hypothetical protein